MVILFYARQTNTCLKPATKSLEITEDISNQNFIQKYNHWMCSIKQLFLFSKTHWKTAVQESLFQ